MAWYSVLGPDYWQTDNSSEPENAWTWSGSAWEFGDGIAYIPHNLEAHSDWFVGYQPTAMRVTITVDGSSFAGSLTNTLNFASFWGAALTSSAGSGTGPWVLTAELVEWLTAPTIHIEYIEYDFVQYITITNIEFESLNPPGTSIPSPKFQDYIGTTETCN